MARKARLYVPLSTGFFRETTVLRAGERSAWLLLAMLAECKQLDSDGHLALEQMDLLPVRRPGWEQRIGGLVDNELVERTPTGYYIPSWEKWNETAAQRAKRLADDRERKKAGKAQDSGRIPDGKTQDSALKEVSKEGEELSTHPYATSPGTQSLPGWADATA